MPPHPGRRGTAFLPIVMITASGEQQRLKALEAGADDFVTKPFDQSELLARVASLARVKRYHDTIHDRPASWPGGTTSSSERVERAGRRAGRINRLRRFLSPQLAELVVESGDESFLLSHRREIVVVFCDLRNFTPFAESSEPEEVMGVLGEYHRALGELIHEFGGTLERFTGDGLMVFFNDPVPCDDAAARAVRMALACAPRSASSPPRWRRRDTTWAGSRHRPGLRDARPDRFRGPLRLRRHRQRDQPGRTAVRRRPRPGRSWSPQRVLAGAEDVSRSEPVGELQPKGFSRSSASSTSPPASPRSSVMTSPTEHEPRPDPLRARRGGARGRFDELQARMPGVWARCGATRTTSPWSSFRRSASTTRRRRRGALDAGDGGAGALPAPAAAATPAADGLRDLDAGQRAIVGYYLGLLPGVIPSHARSRLTLVSVGDSSPRRSARKLLDRPRLLARIAELVPNRDAQPPDPLQHRPRSSATSLSASASRCTAPTRGWPTWAARPGAVGSSRRSGSAPARRGGPAQPREVTDAVCRMRQTRPAWSR